MKTVDTSGATHSMSCSVLYYEQSIQKIEV
jgi:hypothetical protein